jgi:hypothetical protein
LSGVDRVLVRAVVDHPKRRSLCGLTSASNSNRHTCNLEFVQFGKFAREVGGGVGAKTASGRSGVVSSTPDSITLTFVGMARHAKAKSAVLPGFIDVVGQFVIVLVNR